VESTKPIKLMFLSDKKDSSGAATCTIMCADTATAPPPTTTTVLLISGGDSNGTQYKGKSVEIWSPEIHCLLPEFQVKRFDHTQEGLLACGGSADSTIGWGTCEKFENGNWVLAPFNITNRWAHVSWTTDDGVYLIGGGWGTKTSDAIKQDDQVIPGFNLTESMQGHCGISWGDKIILTGGNYWRSNMVLTYNMNGFVSNLPNMTQGRRYHACTKYFNSDNEIVFLVTGGYDSAGSFSSTEILVENDLSWKLVGNLPLSMDGIVAATWENIVFATGGLNRVWHEVQDAILRFDTTSETWIEVANMKNTRHDHAVSVIPLESVTSYKFNCSFT